MRHPIPASSSVDTSTSAWLTLSEAAAYSGRGYSTLRADLAQGRLPAAVRVGRTWRTHRADLDALMVDGPSLTADAAADVIDRLLDTAADDLAADELDALRRRVTKRLGLGGAA